MGSVVAVSILYVIVCYTGGPGLGVLAGCVVTEELGWACTGIQTAVEANSLGVSMKNERSWVCFWHLYIHQS